MIGIGLSLTTIASMQGGGGSVPIAPAIDQPIITSGAGTVTVFPTQTQHTPKRIGDNTTNVDMAGDTKFRYPGVPIGVLIPGSVNTRIVGAMMPGGAAAARRWDMQIEFVTSSKYVGLFWVPTSAAPRILLTVNGRWVSPSFTVTAASGSNSFVRLEFPDNRARRIKFICAGGHGVVRFETEAAYPPVRPTGNDKVLAAIGDSMSAGSGNPPDGATFLDTWPQAVALMLGFDHCCNASIGGTKWVAGGAGDVAISHFGGDRLPLALNINPEAVAFCGSRNDSAVDQVALDAITAAVGAALDATAITKKFVMGTFTALPQNDAVEAGAVAKGVPFIDVSDALTAEGISTDTVHPNYYGATEQIRPKVAPRLRAAGCVPA